MHKRKYKWITSLIVASMLMQGGAIPVTGNERLIAEQNQELSQKKVRVYPKNTIKNNQDERLMKCSLTQPIPVMESNKAGNFIKMIIPVGTPVLHLETLPSGWMHVEVDGEEGYISIADAFIVEEHEPIASRFMPTAEEIDDEIIYQSIYYNAQLMNLRAQPDKTSESLAKIPAGTHIFTQTDKNGWLLVEYDGILGWVNKGLLNEGKGWVINGTIIVNKGYGLSEDFNPGINPEAKEHLDEFMDDAKSNGHNLTPFSDFRTYSRQTTLFKSYSDKDGVDAAETYSARPGHSEHQTGLAFDIGAGGLYTSTEIGTTPGGIWMRENAHRHGFILSYPENKSYITGYQYEPWHFRYVGLELAEILHENNQTLDEYFNTVHPYYKKTEQ